MLFKYYFLIVNLTISEQLELGVEIRTVVKNVRGKAAGEGRPEHALTNKTCRNVGRDYGIKPDGHFNADDKNSCDLALVVLRTRYEAWKRDLCIRKEFPDKSVNEAYVVFATPFQIVSLRNASDKGPVVLGIDSTHKMTAYDHYLTTLVLQDERRHGVPVAFCISVKRDEDTWVKFFTAVRETVGHVVKCDTFISDGDYSFYNAWKRVMTEVPCRRLCLWHAKKSWGERMVQLKFDEDQLKSTKATLDRLVDELDINL